MGQIAAHVTMTWLQEHAGWEITAWGRTVILSIAVACHDYGRYQGTVTEDSSWSLMSCLGCDPAETLRRLGNRGIEVRGWMTDDGEHVRRNIRTWHRWYRLPTPVMGRFINARGMLE